MSNIKNAIKACAVSGAASFIAGAASSADLEVSIEGLRTAEGQALIALFRQMPGNTFPDEEGVIAGQSRPADPNGVTIVFSDLPPGVYALSAFHDSDLDGELDLNILGIPVEGYGFSNGAVADRGPPSFDDAAVTIRSDEERVSVVVPIVYLGH